MNKNGRVSQKYTTYTEIARVSGLSIITVSRYVKELYPGNISKNLRDTVVEYCLKRKRLSDLERNKRLDELREKRHEKALQKRKALLNAPKKKKADDQTKRLPENAVRYHVSVRHNDGWRVVRCGTWEHCTDVADEYIKRGTRAEVLPNMGRMRIVRLVEKRKIL